ncbi:hypothetical protein L1987_53210 [Smallanthus sonchifolius]|uniref:Uncharacterized protein n=1 Tax=Smallanthus sonchifolius TaxID=185202 RepID=A0ACB9EV76_9ASTR|nr:hypothetical protein L1987_53210 [Smallanthus sonchifolius]
MKRMWRQHIGDGLVPSLSRNSVNLLMSNKEEEVDSEDEVSGDGRRRNGKWRLTKVTLPESSSKRKRQETSSEYEPDSDSDAAIQRKYQQASGR